MVDRLGSDHLLVSQCFGDHDCAGTWKQLNESEGS